MRKLLAVIIALTCSTPSRAAIDLDGTNDYLDCGAIHNFTSQNFTLAAWVYFDSLSTNIGGQGPVIFFKGEYRVSGYYFQVSNSGAVSFITNQAGANQSSSTSTGTITAAQWYHIGVTRSGTSARIYVNGIDRNSSSGSHTNPTSSASAFYCGLYTSGGSPYIYANGRLEDIRIYTRALSVSEMENLGSSASRIHITDTLSGYNPAIEGIDGATAAGTGAVRDISGNGNNCTPTNSPIWRASNWVNYP